MARKRLNLAEASAISGISKEVLKRVKATPEEVQEVVDEIKAEKMCSSSLLLNNIPDGHPVSKGIMKAVTFK